MPAPIAAVAPAAPNAPTQTTNVAAPAAPAAAAEAEATFEVTVDGKPAKLTRKQIEKYAGKGAFADQTIRQAKEALAAAKKREAELAERDGIWDDDEKLEAELAKRGKLDKLAQKRLAAKLNEAEMTPEQREIAARDAKIAELEAKTKAADDEKAQQRLSANAERLQKHMIEVLDSAWERVGFERGGDSLMAVHDVMREWKDIGILDPRQPLTPELADRIVEEAKGNVEGSFKRLEKAVLSGLKGKALYDRLGKAVTDELNRYQIELIRGGGAKPKTNGMPPPKPQEAPQYITVAEAQRRARGGQ